MTDILIRDVPEAMLVRIDALAARQHLSRSEWLRRSLDRLAESTRPTISDSDWQRFRETFQDLDDTEVMAQAWR